jgi:hypothetical protein
MATLPDRVEADHRRVDSIASQQPFSNIPIAIWHSFAYFLAPCSRVSQRPSSDGVLGLKSVNHNSAPSGYGIAALALAASWIVLCAPWLFGDVSIPYDAKAHFQAQVQFLANALHSGQSPFWNPHVFAGSPQIADPQSLILSPAVLVALVDPTPSFQLVDGFTFGLMALGGLAILMLFRDRGWHPAGAIVAALGFAFGASAAWRIQHVGQVQSFAFFAIALWLLARTLDRRSIRWGIASGAAAGLMIAEPDQVAFIAALVLAGFVASHWLDGDGRRQRFTASVRPLLAAGLTCLAIAVLPLLMTILFVLSSSRPSIEFTEATRGSLHPASLLTLVFSDLYGAFDKAVRYWGPFSPSWNPNEISLSQNMSQLYIGALPTALIIGLGFSRRLLIAREIRFYTVATLLVIFYALGSNTPFYRLLYEVVPGVALFRRPADATFLMGGLMAILGGYLVHRWVTDTALAESGRASIRFKASVLLLLSAAAIAIAASQGKVDVAIRPIVISLAWLTASIVTLLLVTRTPYRATWAMVTALAVVLTADLALNNGPNESTALPRENFTMLDPEAPNETIRIIKTLSKQPPGSPRRDRVELAGLGFDWPNAAMVHGFDHTLGYNPLRLADFTRAVGAEDSIIGPNQRKFTPLFPSYHCRLANLLGLRYIVSPIPVDKIDRSVRPTDLRFMARTPEGYVYENTEALPRVLFVHNWQIADFGRIMRDGKWPPADPRHTVLLDQRPNVPISGSLEMPEEWTPPSVRILRYENTVIDIEVDTADSGFVVLNDVWHPWWFATIDGSPAKVHKANVLFRAVIVGPGRHQVRFEFAPVAGALQELRAKLAGYRSDSPPAKVPADEPGDEMSKLHAF